MPVSDEMKRIAVLLGKELLAWSDVSQRPMFGLRSFYRGTVVFAMLPDKRALERPRAIWYKLAAGGEKQESRKWLVFEVEKEGDIPGAIACLEKAYRKAV